MFMSTLHDTLWIIKVFNTSSPSNKMAVKCQKYLGSHNNWKGTLIMSFMV